MGLFDGLRDTWNNSKDNSSGGEGKCKWGKYCRDYDSLIKCPECRNYEYCDKCDVCYHHTCEKYDAYTGK